MATKLDDYRLLGRSGLRVSPLSLGLMTFGVNGSWGTTEDDAARMIDLFMDRGGNALDTANLYSGGASECVVGRIIKPRRHRAVISTKYSMAMHPGDANAAGNHRKNMMQSVDASLKRLATDYIDLFYLHIWDFRTPAEEILRGLDDLVRAGKILYAGLSNLPAWEASRMQAIAELRGWAPLIALQIPYNLVERTVERDLLPMALEMNMGVLPWSPLAGGVLTGKYQASDLGKFEMGRMESRRDLNLATGRLTERNLAIAAVVKEIADELGRPPAQIALAWTMLHPAVVSPLIGARTPGQLEGNLAALEIEFSPDQIDRLDACSKIELGFPHEFLTFAVPGMLGGVSVEKRA